MAWAWRKLRLTVAGRKAFGILLGQDRWREMRQDPGGSKTCFGHRRYDVVVKFDSRPGRCGIRSEHAYTEFSRWRNAPPTLRRYLTPIYFWADGMIVQRRVAPCRGGRCWTTPWPPARLRSILRMSHVHHHAHRPRLMFFDYDSLGYV